MENDPINLLRQPEEFKIPLPEYPDGSMVLDQLKEIEMASPPGDRAEPALPAAEFSPAAVKKLADIATHAWRARNRMVDSKSGEMREDLKRMGRHIEAILSGLEDMGIKIEDRTGQPFDYGLPVKVIATEIKAGLPADVVLETLRPTIYFAGRIVQMAEIVVGTPELLDDRQS